MPLGGRERRCERGEGAAAVRAGTHAEVSRVGFPCCLRGALAATGQPWTCEFWSLSRGASPLRSSVGLCPNSCGSPAGGTRRGRVFALLLLLLLPPGTGGVAGSPRAFGKRPLEFSDMSWKLLSSGCPRRQRWPGGSAPRTVLRCQGAKRRGRLASPSAPGGSPLGAGRLTVLRRGRESVTGPRCP